MHTDGNQHIVLRHSLVRTIVFVVIVLGWAAIQVRHLISDPAGQGMLWLQLLAGIVAVILGYVGAMAALQAVADLPVLLTTEHGVAAYNPWGPIFIRWSDIATFEPGNFRWLRIRLRDGAEPEGTAWARFLSVSIRARHTLAVQMYTTIPRPEDVATALMEMKARLSDRRDS